MTEKLTAYCIVRVTDPPVSLTRRENGAFYCHIPVPIPDRLVVFCEGEWTGENQHSVTLTYKDDEILLGEINKSNSCLMWKRDEKMTIPESMLCEKENGLAKLVVEMNEGQKSDADLTDKQEITSTPETSGKNKRRNSLNKADKTPNEPSAKKQKTETPKQNTRTRTPKSQTKEEKTHKKDSPKVENTKSESKPSQAKNKNSPLVERQGNVKKEAASSDDTKKGNKTNLRSKDVQKDEENVEETETKKGKNGNKKDTEHKSPTVNTKDKKEKDEKQNSDIKPKRSKREKPKLDTSNTEAKPVDNVDKLNVTDKENVCVDSNVTADESKKQQGLKEARIQEIKQKLLISGSKLKVASCKDLTRADRPDARWGHTFCFINKNLSVLIGGQGEKQQLCKDGVWSLNNETRRWKLIEVQSESQRPEYRMGHTATYDPLVRCIYVYGGSKNTRWFHDVHMLDLDEWKWQLVKVNGKAPTRVYHSATLYRHELWIFGDVYPRPDPQPDGCSNDIHIINLCVVIEI